MGVMSVHRSRHSLVAVGVGVLVAVLLVTLPDLYFPQGPGTIIELNPGPGITSQMAYREVDSMIAGGPDGPWGMISMQGVVAPSLVAPFGFGQDQCQTLPGSNAWNLSKIPSLNTTLWGGRATFWQFVFLNDSNAMLFATDINGQVALDGPYPAGASCVSELESFMFGLYPPSYWQPTGPLVLEATETALVQNSTKWASTAADNFGNASRTSWAGRLAAYYVNGLTWFNGVQWSNDGWNVWYQNCGFSEVAGLRPWAFTGWDLNWSTSNYYGAAYGSISCPVSQNAHFLISYNGTAPPPLGRGGESALRLRIGVGNGTYAYYDTANSLVTWMAHVSLDSSQSTPVTPSMEQCPANATGVSECPIPSVGWYAVLASPTGFLLDTYPTANGGDNWSLPNVFITNNDSLVILSAQGLAGTGDLLSLTPAYAFPQVVGTTTL